MASNAEIFKQMAEGRTKLPRMPDTRGEEPINLYPVPGDYMVPQLKALGIARHIAPVFEKMYNKKMFEDYFNTLDTATKRWKGLKQRHKEEGPFHTQVQDDMYMLEGIPQDDLWFKELAKRNSKEQNISQFLWEDMRKERNDLMKYLDNRLSPQEAIDFKKTLK